MSDPFLLRISVVIPVYNASAFVGAAVRSALMFDEVKEVILVEDGSSDDGLSVCETLAAGDARVRLLRHPDDANRGASASRNLGIVNASEEWVAFLDADDIYLPGRFDAERSILAEHPDADGVYGAIGVHFHDPEGEALYRRRFSRELVAVRKTVPPERLFEGLSGGIPDFGHFHLDTLTVRRDRLLAMDVLMRPDMRLHQDLEFLIRLSHEARLYPGLSDVPIALRGVHAGNRVTRNEREMETQMQLYAHLLGWAEQRKLPSEVRSRFRNEWMARRVRLAAVSGRPFTAAGLLVRHPSQLKRPDSVGACIDAFARPGGSANRALHGASDRLFAWLWKVKGSARPS